jgi:hypothetical protein
MAGASTIQLPNIESAIALAGKLEENLKLLSHHTGNTARLSFFVHYKQRYFKGYSLLYFLNRAVLDRVW